MAYTFNPSTWEAEAEGSQFEASLVYRSNSRTASATQRNPVSKNKPSKGCVCVCVCVCLCLCMHQVTRAAFSRCDCDAVLCWVCGVSAGAGPLCLRLSFQVERIEQSLMVLWELCTNLKIYTFKCSEMK